MRQAPTLRVPVGAVTPTATNTVTPLALDGMPGFPFAGHGYEVAVYYGACGSSSASFAVPLSLTIAYTSKDVGAIVERALALWAWDQTGAWQPNSALCPGAAAVLDTTARRLANEICAPGRYDLFGPQRKTLLLIAVWH